MEITVNGETINITNGMNVTQLVAQLYPDTPAGAGMAVAIDGMLAPKSKWATTQLEPNNDIIIIKAAYGG